MADLRRDYPAEFVFRQYIDQVLTPRVASDTVWHYTSATGVLGIVEHRELWASSVVTLNDSEEILHGLRIIESCASEQGASRAAALVTTWIRDARAKLNAFDLADSYVLSASLDGESQTQFAIYGKYAVGLNSGMRLTKATAMPGVVPMTAAFELGWRQVLYGDEEKLAHVKRLLQVLGTFADEQVRSSNHRPDIYDTAVDFIVRVAAHLKHRRFAHEEEVRLYGRGDPTGAEVFFRARGEVIVPFIKIQADGSDRRLPLRGVNVGYGLDYEMAEIGLKTALRLNGYDRSPLAIRNVAGSRR